MNEDGCIRIKPDQDHSGLALVWPPDLKMSIEDRQIRVISGLVSGNRQEFILKYGEQIVLGGGEVSNLDEQLQETIPENCPGPYWVVGGIVEPSPITPEPE